MFFENFYDLVYIGLCFGIFCLHCLDLVGSFLKDPEKSAFLLFLIKCLQFLHNTREKLSHLAQILGTYVFQCWLGEISHLLLCSGSILKHHRRVRQIDLLRKRIDGPSLLLCQYAVIKGRFFLHNRRFLLLLCLERIQCQGWRCTHVLKFIAHLIFLHHFIAVVL